MSWGRCSTWAGVGPVEGPDPATPGAIPTWGDASGRSLDDYPGVLVYNTPSGDPGLLMTGGSRDYAATVRLVEVYSLNGWRGGYVQYDGDANELVVGVHDTADETPGNDIEVIRIDRASGRLGIGSAPGATDLLTIGGNVGLPNSGEVHFGGTGTSIVGSSGASGDMTLSAVDDVILNPADDLVVQAGGSPYVTFDGANHRVGVGTTTPSQELDVNGDIRVATNGRIEFGGTTTYVTGSSSVEGDLTLNAVDDIFVQVGGATYVTFDGGLQRVGIGTTTPNQELEVNGDIRVATNGRVEFGGTSTYVAGSSAAGGDLTLNAVDDIVFQVGGATYVTFDGGTQRVGIGTASPARTLELSGYCRVGNNDRVEFGGTSTFVSGNNTSLLGGDLTLSAYNAVVFDPLGTVSGKAVTLPADVPLKWGSDIAILGKSSGDVHFKYGSDVIAALDRTNLSLCVGWSGPTSSSLTKLDVRGSPTGSAGNPVAYFQNDGDSTITTKRILRLTFSGDATIGTNEDYIQFEDSGGEVGRIHSDVAYGTFTGCHDGQTDGASEVVPVGRERRLRDLERDEDWLLGMIVVSTGRLITDGVSRALPAVGLARNHRDPAVMGVFTGARPGAGIKGFDPEKPAITYNALGEGQILVCDANGEVNLGDYVASSEVPGFGQRQDDDVLHNYTVAKCTQTVDWSGVVTTVEHGGQTFKCTLVACTYHCG